MLLQGVIMRIKRFFSNKKRQSEQSNNYNTSLSDTKDGLYPNFCQQAVQDDSIFAYFRTNPIYTTILEHVDMKLGQQYLNVILESRHFHQEHFQDFQRNDWVGGASIAYYKEVGYFCPSTLRYIKVLSDLITSFSNLNGKKICEIGVGYGGQARILCSFFKDIQSYTFVDLDSVLRLSQKYLSHFDDITTALHFTPMENLQSQNYDIVISNYAFSELCKNIQDIYINKIIKNATHGYITYNDIAEKGFNYPLQDYANVMQKNIQIREETPNSHPFNKIIIW